MNTIEGYDLWKTTDREYEDAQKPSKEDIESMRIDHELDKILGK